MAETSRKTHKSKKTAKEPCCGAAPEGAPSSCCELQCFERPRYFCGHLLTDSDLSREQRYVVEKNKLHNRSLHGHGVVCGLRLTCDPDCTGRIIVGEGYAIDDCGNDLVVCAPTPFDVLGSLREKRWAFGKPKSDPCKPEKKSSDCPYRQCFYIVACYEEELTDYTTPFSATCSPPTGQCEATRVRERVRFDVLDELPEQCSMWQEMRARVERCSRLFTDGPFAQALQEHGEVVEGWIRALQWADQIVVVEDGSEEWRAKQEAEWRELQVIFSKLRGLFLLYLCRNPDPYRCGLVDDVQAISLPQSMRDRSAVGKAFWRLLELCHQYVVDCIFGELAFPCPAPETASCVVLGTVEIVDGRLVRVSNAPRSYVWSPANAAGVLAATIVGRVGRDPCGDHREQAVDSLELMRVLGAKSSAQKERSTKLFGVLESLVHMSQEVFDITRPDHYGTPLGEIWASVAQKAGIGVAAKAPSDKKPPAGQAPAAPAPPAPKPATPVPAPGTGAPDPGTGALDPGTGVLDPGTGVPDPGTPPAPKEEEGGK